MHLAQPERYPIHSQCHGDVPTVQLDNSSCSLYAEIFLKEFMLQASFFSPCGRIQSECTPFFSMVSLLTRGFCGDGSALCATSRLITFSTRGFFCGDGSALCATSRLITFSTRGFFCGDVTSAAGLRQLALAFHFVLLSHHHAASSFHSRRPSYFFRSSFLEEFCLVPSGFHSTAWC